MNAEIVLDPILAWPLVIGAGALALLCVALAAWRGLSGWWLRGLAALALLAALLNPALREEERDPLTDIVVAVVDESTSQRVSDRAEQSAEALAQLEAEVARRENTELRVVRVGDAPDGGDGGSLVDLLGTPEQKEIVDRVTGVMSLLEGHADVVMDGVGPTVRKAG